jgi:hypothetical protein
VSEAALPLFELDPSPPAIDLADDVEVRDLAAEFCRSQPYRLGSFGKRNWGGFLHSLCSYQGKLKPSIAHFLISWFTEPGQVVLDPMSGVGTIPLEARLQGRLAVGGDLSELAYVVTKAKVEEFAGDDVVRCVEGLLNLLAEDSTPLDRLIERESAKFGLNGKIDEYFEERTLREVLLARSYFRGRVKSIAAGEAVVLSCLLHMLHGNRPYALSRRSHPVTPLKPTGPFVYRSLAHRLVPRVQTAVGELGKLDGGSLALHADLNDLPIQPESVDAVITSPPFAASLRFFSSNWMRLWFCGWQPDEFKTKPPAFLEGQQKADFIGSYRRFSVSMARMLRPGGLMVMHVGETAKFDMAAALIPIIEPEFSVIYSGREVVADTESHGLSDKGATRAHHFLFARKRAD